MKPLNGFISGILLLSCFDSVIPARILFLFPLPYGSHFRAFVPVVEELAIRGHDITAYVHPNFKRQEPLQNYKEVLVHANLNATSLRDFDFTGMRKASVFRYTLNLWTLFAPMTEDALQTPGLCELMETQQHFDVIILEATMLQEPLLGFAHKFGAAVINLYPMSMTTLTAWLTGSPNPLSYVPDFRLPYAEHMSFWQRVYNVILGTFDLTVGSVYFLPSQEKVMRRNFKLDGLPPLKDLIANISLHLLLTHPMMHIRPYSPNVVQVAGMQIKSSTKLPEDVKKFMDEAPDGVIYFSLGSFIEPKLFSDQVRRVITETLKNVKQRVIFKWPDKIDEDPKNILQRSWLPQTAILAHPKCKLFITHGGINSLFEVMRAGVPVLGLPVFADQFHNVAYYEHIGVGLGAIVDNLTIEDFTEKINRIINTPSFAENSRRWSNIYRDLPETSLERAVFWVEYVIRHRGAHHLKPASVTMPFYKHLLLDVIGFCSASLFLIGYILIWIVRGTLKILKLSFKGGVKKTRLNKKYI